MQTCRIQPYQKNHTGSMDLPYFAEAHEHPKMSASIQFLLVFFLIYIIITNYQNLLF